MIARSSLLGLVFVASVARAQTVSFKLPIGDTVFAVVAGRTAQIDLQVSTGGAGLKEYSITLFIDRNRFRLVAADTVPGGYGLPQPSVDTSVADQITLSASGTGSSASTVPVARLTFEANPSVGPGSLVSLRANSLTDLAGASLLPNSRFDVLDMCQADRIWGDVAVDLKVNSRDALVIITAAVGLPVSGPSFDLAPGDVDLDTRVTSRDALFVLSAGIGLGEPTGRVGKAIPARCGPLAPAPDDMLFLRGSTLYGVAEGDSVPVSFLFSPEPVASLGAVWSPDRTRILYTAYTSAYWYEVISADSAGTSVDTLTRDAAWDGGADWSPDGSMIAFVSARSSPTSVWIMNADGSNPKRVTTTVTVAQQRVSWRPDGTLIAFVGYSVCCSNSVWIVGVDGTGLREVVAAGESPTDVVWSASGDTLYYTSGSLSRVRQVAVSDGVRDYISRLVGSSHSPGASRAGPAFLSQRRFPYDFFLRRSTDGRHLRIVRGTSSASGERITFRRTGAIYVDTVTVSPDSVDLFLSGQNQQQFTATVRNNDGSTSNAPVRWLSRNPAKVAIDSLTGLATAVDTTSGVFVIATVSGWRSDSAKVKVNP
ncbi:Protein TolB [bacterium HR33]|nr:Protein TolB [bacterium HR33]